MREVGLRGATVLESIGSRNVVETTCTRTHFLQQL